MGGQGRADGQVRGPSLPHNAIVLQTRGKQDDKSAGWVVPTPSPDSQVPPPSPHGQVARAWRACPPGGLLLPGPGTRPSRSPSVRSEPSPPLPSSAVLRVLRINVRVFRRCLLRPASHQLVIITPRWLCLVPAPRRWRRGAKPWPRRRRGPLAVCGWSKRVFSQTARRWRPQRLPFFLTPHSVGSLGAAAPAGCVHSLPPGLALPASPPAAFGSRRRVRRTGLCDAAVHRAESQRLLLRQWTKLGFGCKKARGRGGPGVMDFGPSLFRVAFRFRMRGSNP